MAMRQRKRIRLAQNFLKDSGLVRRLVHAAAIDPSDIVYEIGPGRGIITAELSRAAAKVIAVEKDPVLASALRERFRARDNVKIVERDFLKCSIADREYKIFASIPYNLTADIVRKILYVPPTPIEAYLIMQKEPAKKFSGFPAETLFSLLAKPFFEFSIVTKLRRTDFFPVPDVDSVLLHIHRRTRALVPREDVAFYRDFVSYGFGRWKRHLRSAFKHVFTYNQWKRLSRDLRFPLNATPTQLTFDQWLGLYRGFKQLAAHVVRSAESGMRERHGSDRSRF
jgi:23S rRNA (adenine-N6)-dimethyltransferase